jgi:signal transduction histidine kinase
MLDSFFISGALPPDRLAGNYNFGLVILSFVIASLASYVALDMASQLRRDFPPRIQRFWHVGGAIAMGTGIWAMHFTGMLAYNMGMPHDYNTGITLLSLILPILFAYGVLYIIKQGYFNVKTLLLAAPFLGLSIVAMHYTGMAAMQMQADLRYRPDWFLFSIFIAVTTSAVALWLAMRASTAKSGYAVSFKLLGALVMGAAICGMHYAGMTAAVFIPHSMQPMPAVGSESMNTLLAAGIGTATLLILGLTLAALAVNQKIASHLKEQVIRRTEELEAAKKMAETANLAKSEFLAKMSHEMRTPLNAVVGIVHLLNQGAVPVARQAEFYETLQKSTHSLLEIINEVLDISKIEKNNITLEHIDFSLRDLTQDIMSLFAMTMHEKNLRYTLDYPGDQHDHYYGDTLRIRQIVVNLISNAIKFTDVGEITLRVRQNAGADGVLIKVSDTGIGIAAEKLNIIFDKFTQADDSITRKYGGSGLGLAICKGLVERMEGRIEVTSTLNKGTEFTVYLPLQPVASMVLAIA